MSIPIATKTVAARASRLVHSPFGTRKPLPVFIERTILEIDRVYVNGGRRGFLLSMAPSEIVSVLGATLVDVATMTDVG